MLRKMAHRDLRVQCAHNSNFHCYYSAKKVIIFSITNYNYIHQNKLLILN